MNTSAAICDQTAPLPSVLSMETVAPSANTNATAMNHGPMPREPGRRVSTEQREAHAKRTALNHDRPRRSLVRRLTGDLEERKRGYREDEISDSNGKDGSGEVHSRPINDELSA